MLPLLVGLSFGFPADTPPTTAKAALQPFGRLVGSWRATGYPAGPRDEPKNRFWAEKVAVEWRFQGDDAWLTFAFDNGKHFSKGELRYDPDRTMYRLILATPDKQTLTFAAHWSPTKPDQGPSLILERTDTLEGNAQRIGLRLLHANRFLYWSEEKLAARKTFTRRYQVGATKEGEPFADVAKGPECIVSGGDAKTPVTHNGKTYYICCSGCREAFREDPEKYIREAEVKRKN